MSYKPILFNLEELKDINNRNKTAIIQPVPDLPLSVTNEFGYDYNRDGQIGFVYSKRTMEQNSIEKRVNVYYVTPRYQKGDILWVKEPFGILYKNGRQVPYYLDTMEKNYEEIKWYSLRSMTKKYARLFLKIVDVKISSLLFLNPEDVMNLGIELNGNINDGHPLRDNKQFKLNSVWDNYLKESSLNRYCWDDISYVFRYKFERCGMPEDFLSEKFSINTEKEYTTTYYDEATRNKFMTHICPICGYKSNLESHIATDKDGKTVESPWPVCENSVPFVPIEIDSNRFYVCYDCYQNFLCK